MGAPEAAVAAAAAAEAAAAAATALSLRKVGTQLRLFSRENCCPWRFCPLQIQVLGVSDSPLSLSPFVVLRPCMCYLICQGLQQAP